MASKCRKKRDKKRKQALLGRGRIPSSTRAGGTMGGRKPKYKRGIKYKGNEEYDQDD